MDTPNRCTCGRLTDPKKSECCRVCGSGQHMMGCTIRQIGYGEIPADLAHHRMVRA